MIGVIDTCFLIDWSRFRRRNVLKKLFNLLLIHEDILRQIKSEETIEYTSRLFAEGILRLYPWSEIDEREFINLRNQVSSNSRIPSLERPDILYLIIAYNNNAILLSENLGIHRVVQYHPKYSRVKVWTALDVLEQAVYSNVIRINSEEEFLHIIKEYVLDTYHSFRKKRIESSLNRVRKWLTK